jgi:hypothetical protein
VGAGGLPRKTFEILHCCRFILAQVWRKKIGLSSSVKATAASHSGEMINYETIYAFNFKFLRRNIIVDYDK